MAASGEPKRPDGAKSPNGSENPQPQPAFPKQTFSKADFSEIVEEHWSAVYRLIYNLCGSAHDTEDLTQETFLRALNRLDSFQPGTKMRAWLLRIATNAWFDVRRKRMRVTMQSMEMEPPETEQPVEDRLAMAEQAALLRTAMLDLPEVTRMVFHLRVTEELSFAAIGEMAGVSEEAARWHMHQARTKLLRKMTKEPVRGAGDEGRETS